MPSGTNIICAPAARYQTPLRNKRITPAMVTPIQRSTALMVVNTRTLLSVRWSTINSSTNLLTKRGGHPSIRPPFSGTCPRVRHPGSLMLYLGGKRRLRNLPLLNLLDPEPFAGEASFAIRTVLSQRPALIPLCRVRHVPGRIRHLAIRHRQTESYFGRDPDQT